MVTGLEEEALHVVRGIIFNSEHGEELAVFDRLALFLAGNLEHKYTMLGLSRGIRK
jgi:hypothetical protein